MPVTALKVGLCPSVAEFAPEAKYVLRTLARIAGYGTEFGWADGATDAPTSWDVFYGPSTRDAISARVRIDAQRQSFAAWDVEPSTFHEQERLGFIEFDATVRGFSRTGGSVHFHNDILRGSYWLLAGAREQRYERDRHGSANLTGSFLFVHGLLARPLVSEYAAFLTGVLREAGLLARPLPWTQGTQAAFSFTHDVDYPQMIRWIECLRLLWDRGPSALRSITGVLNGTNNFWKFADWIDFEAAVSGARPAFYFSARRGSLLQYATGTPDCFYDIRSAEFRDLFKVLRDAGCEVGLHTSYHAFRDVATIARERENLERALGDRVAGNRHHYFRLNPDAPHETLARHDDLGFEYDSSLAFAYYPGFRRGVCHPFHVFHPRERRELKILQLPVAWMDDHFHRRLTINGITDAEEAASGLLGVVRRTSGVAAVDYHVRGMNGDFFPQYAPWLKRFAERHLDSSLRYLTPIEVTREYSAYEAELDAVSRDSALHERSLGGVVV